jgi:hypothetical protein
MSVRTGLRTIIAVTDQRDQPDTALEHAWGLAANGEARIAPAREPRKDAQTETEASAFPNWRATTLNQFGIRLGGQLPGPRETSFSPHAGLRSLLWRVPPAATAAYVRREAGTPAQAV